MVIAFLLMLILPFVFYFTQLKNINAKINAIKKAIEKKEDTFLDPTDGKTYSTKTGEQVRLTYIYSFTPPSKEYIAGDKVLKGINTGRIYRNYSCEKYIEHIKKQIEKGECWCGERKCFRDHGYVRDFHIKYHMNDKYYYILESEIKRTPLGKGKFGDGSQATVYYYKIIIDPKTKAENEKIEITFKEYKKLGGERTITQNTIEHLK